MYASSSPAFCMMYSAYKLNKQDDNIQPWHTPFPILNQSVFPCLVLTVASWPAYRFLRRQVRWSGIPIFLRISQSLSWSTQSKALALSVMQRYMSFSRIPLLFLWSNGCWQFDPWFFCLYCRSLVWRILSIIFLACESESCSVLSDSLWPHGL